MEQSVHADTRTLQMHSGQLPYPGPAATPLSRSDRSRDLFTTLQHLHSSLDLQGVIQHFFVEVVARVTVDGIEYKTDQSDFICDVGRNSGQSCTYFLTVDNLRLGELTFFRDHPFAPAELRRLEDILCMLVSPLRNAIRYQEALDCAHRDPLTGLANREALRRHLDREIALAVRHATALSLMVIDVDEFKQINDTHGHLLGDSILKSVARVLSGSFRNTELVYRYGGDEFVALLSNTNIAGSRNVAERVKSTLEASSIQTDDGDKVSITASIGIAELGQGDDASRLFDRADEMMYAVKREGGNGVCATPGV